MDANFNFWMGQVNNSLAEALFYEFDYPDPVLHRDALTHARYALDMAEWELAGRQ